MKLSREWILKDEIWISRVVRKCSEPGLEGECDPSTHEMLVRRQANKEEMKDTLSHELLHAISFAWDLNLSERLVRKLERPLRCFLEDNF